MTSIGSQVGGALLALVLAFPSPAPAGVIPITVANNSFEQTDKDQKWPLEWASDNRDKFGLDADAKDGKWSFHAHDDSESWPTAYQVVNGIQEGSVISAALWARTDDISTSEDNWKVFRVYLKFIPMDGKETTVDLVSLTGTNPWKWYMKKKIKVPTGLKEIRLVVGMDGVNGNAWVDRVVLVKGEELPPETITTSAEVGNRAEVLKAAIGRSRAAIRKEAINAGPREALSEARAKIVTATLLAKQLEEDAAESSTRSEDGRVNGPEKTAAMRRAAALVREKVATAVRLIEEAEAAQEHETPAKAEEISAARANDALAAIREAETASEAVETAATPSKVLMGTWGGGVYGTSSASKWEESNADAPHPYVTFILADADGRVYCGGDDKFLYDSDDNGKTWSGTPTRLPVVPTGFTLDPDHPEHWAIASWGQGVWWSEDAGRNWTRGDAPTAFLRRMTRLGGAYYTLGDDTTVLTCREFKGTWTPVATLPRGIKGWDVALKPGRAGTLLVATDAGVAEVAGDGSLTFPKLDVSSAWARSLAVDLDRVLIGTWGRGVIEWRPGASSTPYAVLINDGINNKNIFALAVSLNPKPEAADNGTIAEGPHVWTDRNGGIGGFKINAIIANPKDEKEMYCSAETGVYHSTDQGANWVKTAEMTAPNVGVMAIDPGSPETIYAAAAFYNIASGIQKTTDGGKTWSQKLLGLKTMWVELDKNSPATLYAATYGGGVYRSDDGGENWVEYNTGLPSNILYCVIAGSQDPRQVFAGMLGKGLQRFDDAAKAWVDASRGINATDVWHLAQDPTDGNTWLVGTAGGGMFKTADGGKNWRAITKGLTINGVYRVVYDPHKPGVVYAGGKAVVFGGSGGGVFRSTDNGESWAPDNEGLSNLNIEGIYVTKSGLVYVSTTSGVFYKQD